MKWINERFFFEFLIKGTGTLKASGASEKPSEGRINGGDGDGGDPVQGPLGLPT